MKIYCKWEFIIISIFIATLSLLIISGNANANPEDIYSFRGTTLRVSFSEFENSELLKTFDGKETNLKCSEHNLESLLVRSCKLVEEINGITEASIDIGGRKADNITYVFIKTTYYDEFLLEEISIKLDISNYGILSHLFRTKYGNSNSGNTFGTKSISFHNESSTIFLLELSTEPSKMVVIYQYNALSNIKAEVLKTIWKKKSLKYTDKL